MLQPLKTIRSGKFIAEIYERVNRNRYPLHSHSVMFKQDTPKGKYSKFKILNHFVYKSEAEAEQAASTWIAQRKEYAERRQNEVAKRRKENSEVNAEEFYKVGDIIVNSWGWEQTNINFYQVVKVGNRTIEIKEICQTIKEGSMYAHGMACEVIPLQDVFLNDGACYRLTVKSGGTLSNPESYYYMHKWNGKPEYKSWYA